MHLRLFGIPKIWWCFLIYIDPFFNINSHSHSMDYFSNVGNKCRLSELTLVIYKYAYSITISLYWKKLINCLYTDSWKIETSEYCICNMAHHYYHFLTSCKTAARPNEYYHCQGRGSKYDPKERVLNILLHTKGYEYEKFSC